MSAVTAEYRLRKAAFRETVAYLRTNSFYYRNVIESMGIRGDDLAELQKFTPITRDQLTCRSSFLRCQQGFPEIVQYTSGSSGSPLSIYKTREELNVIQEILCDIFGDNTESLNLGLALIGTQHGLPTRLRILENCFTADVGHINGLDYSKTVLEKEHRFDNVKGHVRLLVGSLNDIKRLTIHLLSKRFEPLEHHVERIVLWGAYLSAPWRNRLKEFWHCDPLNIYGLTEIGGGAHECHLCKSFHFDPFVIPELVRLNDNQIAANDGEVGQLLLSSLFPFCADHLLLRYDTGDLFEFNEKGCPSGLPRFNFLGRRTQCLLLHLSADRIQFLVSTPQVRDVLDAIPDVAYETQRHRVEHLPPGSLGRPRFSLSIDSTANKTTVQLSIALMYPPYLYPERSKKIMKLVHQRLPKYAPHLFAAVDKGLVQFDVILHGSDTPIEGVDA